MPIVIHDDVPLDPFRSGATYQTVVGDAQGSTPFRIGIQTSSPGYRTPLHSHPYMEALTILEGEGEAWMEGGDPFPVKPGMTLVFPAPGNAERLTAVDVPMIARLISVRLGSPTARTGAS